MEIKEITAKSIMNKSNLPSVDFAINPYVGCEFGCAYCYASFMCRFADKKISDWGNFVHVKINAVELLEQKLHKFKSWNSSIFFSSATDPYQGVEAKYKLTQKLLQTLSQQFYPGKISILTKSSLVTRDIELFDTFRNIEVGLTITSTDDDISRFLEFRASNVNARLEALKKLNKAGLKTYAFIGPLLPHFSLFPEKLDALFKAIRETGTQEIFVEHLNMKPYILQRLKPFLENSTKNIQDIYSQKQNVDSKIYELVKKYNFKLRLNKTIEHSTL